MIDNNINIKKLVNSFVGSLPTSISFNDVLDYLSSFTNTFNRSCIFYSDQALNIGAYNGVSSNPTLRFAIKNLYSGTRIEW